MDRLDIRILRELFQGQTVWPARPGLSSSYRQVARRIGAPPGTVRNRLQEMTRTGVLNGIGVYANPATVGVRGGSYAIEVPASQVKTSVIARLLQIDGVYFLENFHGRLLGIGLGYRDERALEKLLARIDRAAGAARGIFTEVHHPPCPQDLSRLDREVIRRLVLGDYPSYSRLAEELRVSPRTLRRHVDRLARDGAIMSFPHVNYRAMTGEVTAELLVAFVEGRERTEREAELIRLLDDSLIFAGIWERFAIFRLILPNVARATELATTVSQFSGIRFARMEFVDELIERMAVLRPKPEARSRAPARSTRRVPVRAASGIRA